MDLWNSTRCLGPLALPRQYLHWNTAKLPGSCHEPERFTVLEFFTRLYRAEGSPIDRNLQNIALMPVAKDTAQYPVELELPCSGCWG